MCDELAHLGSERPASGLRARAGAQARRELLLAQSSDWPFLVTTGQAGQYAMERFRVHEQRFARSLAIARAGSDEDDAELRTLERVDDVFPDATLAGVG